MRDSLQDRLIRLGVFYDGGFFSRVSDYYRHFHQRRARLSIQGLHRFAIFQFARTEGIEGRHCRIVETHYFRGRLSAEEAMDRDKLLNDRRFDDVLTRMGVTAHYLPLSSAGEKGIDVWLALEAFELAMYRRFDLLVLLAGDGDYLPLARKLNALGTRMMLLGWDLTWQDKNGRRLVTRTSQALLEEVTYPVMMQDIIDRPEPEDEQVVNELFLTHSLETGRPVIGDRNE